jgi:hypothetical protein
MKINEENLLITDGKNNKKQSNKWILINIPIQMGLLFLFAYGGNWLDENYPNPKVYNKILVMVGVALALYNVIRQVNEINKSQ